MPNRASTERAASDPQPGDYWHEMLCGVCLVIARAGERVCVCWTKRAVDNNHYEFVNPEWMSVATFKDRLSYKTIPGYFADVSEKRHDVSSYEIPPCGPLG